MKVRFDHPILNLDNTPILGPDDKPLLLRTVVQGALTAMLPEDQRLGLTEKAELFRLALLAKDDEADLPVADISKILDRVGAACGSLAVGRAKELLDPVTASPAGAKPARRGK